MRFRRGRDRCVRGSRGEPFLSQGGRATSFWGSVQDRPVASADASPPRRHEGHKGKNRNMLDRLKNGSRRRQSVLGIMLDSATRNTKTHPVTASARPAARPRVSPPRCCRRGEGIDFPSRRLPVFSSRPPGGTRSVASAFVFLFRPRRSVALQGSAAVSSADPGPDRVVLMCAALKVVAHIQGEFFSQVIPPLRISQKPAKHRRTRPPRATASNEAARAPPTVPGLPDIAPPSAGPAAPGCATRTPAATGPPR